MPVAQAAHLAAQVVIAIGRILDYNMVEILWTGGDAVHIAICDDNPHDLQQLQALLRQYDSSMQIATFPTAKALYESTVRYDAVILDIEMEAPNGFEIALCMARQESHPIILFATNSAAYAVQGYGLALRYLLKPLTIESVTEALDAARQELQKNRLRILLDDTAHVLNVQDIYYAEVQGHYITLHTVQGPLRFRGTLKDIVAQLPRRWFSASHQSFVVNLLHVRTVSQSEVFLTNGCRIPISRRRQAEFLQAFHAFLGVDAW